METKLIQSTDKRETRTACGPRLLFLSAERIGGDRDNLLFDLVIAHIAVKACKRAVRNCLLKSRNKRQIS